MTNEELVFRIQQGERDLLPQLWEGVRGYVAKTARSYMVIYDGRYGVEFDDLIQSGFLAMVAAVESYEPKDAKFTTWLTYHLKTAFKNAANKAIEILNQMIMWMNQKLKFTIPALTIMGETIWEAKSVTLASIPSIPYLAQGAVIPPNREFMAVLGDQKSGTNIEAPLSTIEQAVRNVIGSFGGKHTVIMEIDGREFGKVTYDAYNRESQRLGVSLGGG